MFATQSFVSDQIGTFSARVGSTKLDGNRTATMFAVKKCVVRDLGLMRVLDLIDLPMSRAGCNRTEIVRKGGHVLISQTIEGVRL